MQLILPQFKDFNLEQPEDLVRVERNGYVFQMSKDPFCRMRFKGRKKSVVAYKYSLGMHMIAGHGNMDAVEKIRMGEKVVWSESNILYNSNLNRTTDYSVIPRTWIAQPFIASADYTLSSIELMLWKPAENSPGIITISIRAIDGSGHPTGDDLCVGTTDGNTLPTGPTEWREIEFTAPIILESGTKYAIVARSTESWARWSANNEGDADNRLETSANAGGTWETHPGDLAMLFKSYRKSGSAPNCSIAINSPNIFGGDKKEGGVSGVVDLMFGDITQDQNIYLKDGVPGYTMGDDWFIELVRILLFGQPKSSSWAGLGDDIPAFRGLFSAILNQVYIGTSPYLKPWSFFLKRVCKQISGDIQWYKEKAVIRPREEAGDDLNAIHIIRECLIDKEWGLGWSTDDINDSVWKDAADILYDEGFGLSMLWDQVMPIEDFVDEILSYIAGILYQDLETGKWIVTLTREPTDASYLRTSYTDDDSQYGSIYNVRWVAQTFKVPNYGNFDITSVGLKLVRTGGPAADPLVTISIRETDNYRPTGTDLCSGTIAGGSITQDVSGAWYRISFVDGATLEAGKRYAIVMRVPAGTDPSSIDWFIKYTGDYNEGDFFSSLDSGENWIGQSYDAVFKVYSEGSLYGIETFDENDIIELDEFTRPSYGEIIDQVVVKFWDKLAHKSRSTEARDIALIEKQGGAVIEKILNYHGICNAALANRVAERELKLATSMLAGMRLRCTRRMSHLKPNDIFKLSWPDLDITQMIIRVLNINYGNLDKNEIYLTCVEDAFLAPTTIYGDAPDTLWTDSINEPADIINRRLIEIPYWSLCKHVIGSLSLVAALDDDTGFLCVIAEKPTEDAFDYDILARLSASYDFEDIGAGNNSFTPTGVLTNDLAMNAEDVVIDLSSESDLDLVDDNTYALINDEIIKILSVDSTNNQITIARGILDTAPAAHSSGDRIYFMGLHFGEIDFEYTNDDTPSTKLLSRTANGSLAEADATVETASALNSRMIRPYLPGNLKFNGESYPEFISSAAHGNKTTISWNHRDRTDPIQLNSLVEHSDSGIGLELGASYTIKIYDAGNTLRRTVTGLSGTSYDYTEAFEISDCGSLQTQLRFVIYTVRAGYDSFQSYDITLRRAFRGTSDATSNSWGWLIPYPFDGRNRILPISSTDGILSINTELGSSVVEISGASGILGSFNITTELQGSIAGVSGAEGILACKLEGSTGGISGADGVLNLAILKDYYNTGADDDQAFSDLTHLCQSFTASENYDIASIALKLFRIGSPGTITVELYLADDSTNKPTGGILASGTTDGDTLTVNTNGEWRTITFGSSYSLTNGEEYVIVCRAAGHITSVNWIKDASAPSYAGGQGGTSNDAGFSWVMDISRDMYFKTYSG